MPQILIQARCCPVPCLSAVALGWQDALVDGERGRGQDGTSDLDKKRDLFRSEIQFTTWCDLATLGTTVVQPGMPWYDHDTTLIQPSKNLFMVCQYGQGRLSDAFPLVPHFQTLLW